MTEAGNSTGSLLRFRYRAVAMDGRITKGEVAASGVERARSKLMGMQLAPLELSIASTHRWKSSPLSDSDLALGARILSDLLGSGLSIGRALHTFQDLAPAPWRRHLPRLQDDVRAGVSLSAALANLDGAVPSLFVGLTRAGEVGTGLASALDSAALLYDASAQGKAALISALTYPAFLLVVCTSSVVLLGGVVLPRFAALLTDLGQALPKSTATLLSVSAAARQAGLPVLTGIVMVMLTLWLWSTSDRGRPTWHATLLRLPLVGDARHAWASASVCVTAGTLVQSGVILSTALHHAASTCGDAAVATRVASARQEVLAGARPSDALAQHQALTRTAMRLLRAGEESGKVPGMLLRAAQIERARAMRILSTSLKLVEPSLVIAFGGLVASVATALLQAVYAIRPGQ